VNRVLENVQIVAWYLSHCMTFGARDGGIVREKSTEAVLAVDVVAR
jgi:hypothetical protein